MRPRKKRKITTYDTSPAGQEDKANAKQKLIKENAR